MAINSYFNENTLEELIEEIKYVYKSDERPWVIGYSGGKDSTTVVELVYKMLLSLPNEQRKKNVYIVSSDTLIENPLIKIYLNKMNKLLGEAAEKDKLPIISTMVTPPANNSFWANVIGRGFPTPRMNGSFRWCTDRLKINPSADYIRSVIKKEGQEVVVLLGVRKAESIARKRRIEGRELANRLMNRHETIQDAYVYNPIVELTTDDAVLFALSSNKKSKQVIDYTIRNALNGDGDVLINTLKKAKELRESRIDEFTLTGWENVIIKSMLGVNRIEISCYMKSKQKI